MYSIKIYICLQRGVFVNDLTERSCHDSKQLFDVFNDGEGMYVLNVKYVCSLFCICIIPNIMIYQAA